MAKPVDHAELSATACLTSHMNAIGLGTAMSRAQQASIELPLHANPSLRTQTRR